jgi:hypothetical protein
MVAKTIENFVSQTIPVLIDVWLESAPSAQLINFGTMSKPTSENVESLILLLGVFCALFSSLEGVQQGKLIFCWFIYFLFIYLLLFGWLVGWLVGWLFVCFFFFFFIYFFFF